MRSARKREAWHADSARLPLLAADNHPDLRWLVPEIDQPMRDEVEEEEDESARASAVDKATKPSREIRIDQVRAIGEFLTLATHRGGRRVVVLAPAEALNGPRGKCTAEAAGGAAAGGVLRRW